MQIRDVMTDSVVSVSPSDTIPNVAKKMNTHDIGIIPVCDNGSLLGVITDRDIVLRCVATDKDINSIKASDIMSSHAVSISPNQSVEEAANLMAKAQFRRLPVTDSGKIVGMVSIGDLARLNNYDMETAKALSEISEDRYD